MFATAAKSGFTIIAHRRHFPNAICNYRMRVELMNVYIPSPIVSVFAQYNVVWSLFLGSHLSSDPTTGCKL